jgi:hypothetical protein
MTPQIGISGKQPAENPLIFRRSLFRQTRPPLTDDVEFVHDQVGITRGREQMVSLTKKGVCSIPGLRLRREQIAGSVHYYPLMDRGKVYGAVVSGEHQFFASENGAAEILDSRARFTHVLLRKQGAWKLSRIVSYDHEMITLSDGK